MMSARSHDDFLVCNNGSDFSAARRTANGKSARDASPIFTAANSGSDSSRTEDAELLGTLGDLNLTPIQYGQVVAAIVQAMPELESLAGRRRRTRTALIGKAASELGYAALVVEDQANEFARRRISCALRACVAAVLTPAQRAKARTVLAAKRNAQITRINIDDAH